VFGAVWKRWNWLEDALIPLFAVLMHASWAFPLFALYLRNGTTGAANPGFGFGLCFAVLAGGFFAGRLASQNRLGLVIVAVGGLAAIWIALLLVMPEGSQDLQFLGRRHPGPRQGWARGGDRACPVCRRNMRCTPLVAGGTHRCRRT